MSGRKGRSGVRALPTELKILRGTDRPDRRPANTPEPEILSLAPEPPVALDRWARAEWDRIAPELVRLHLLSHLDLGALVGYCQAFGDAIAARKHIARNGRYVRTKSGGFTLSPAVRDAYRAAELMRGYLIEFGMSPSSRARVVTGGGGSIGKPNGETQGPRPRPANRFGQAI